MIILISAIDKNFGIGIKGDMLTYIKEDLKYFKETTLGATLIMGRKTWDSLPENSRPLPGRKNVVISKSIKNIEQATVYSSIEEAIKEESKHNGNIFIIGGGNVYKQTIDIADKLYLTHIFNEFKEVDTYFPTNLDNFELEEVICSKENIMHKKYPHIFARYTRLT